MLDAIAKAQAETATLRPFLHDIARGCLTRRGYRVFTLLWLGRTTTRAQKALVGRAISAGLVAWPGHTGPNVVAALTPAGAKLLEALK